MATEIRKRAAGADGRAIGKSHIREEKVMTAETCAKILIRDVAKRKRESYMTGRGKISAWLRVIAPSLLDYFAGRAIKH